MRAADDELWRLLAEALPCRDRRAERFLPQLLARPGVVAVVFYGSLRAGVASAGSEPDLFVVVRSLGDWFGDGPGAWRDRALASWVPPSTCRLRCLDGGRVLGAKLCVLSVEQLERETSARAADLFHLGRLSKRVGLLHDGDQGGEGARLVLSARRSALLVLRELVLALLPGRFSLDEFLIELLGISYRGEPRIAEPGRARALLAADAEHYRALGRVLLAAVPGVLPDGARGYRQPEAPAASRQRTLRFIERSRRRALLRWPKYLVTFDGWLDYVEAKLERHAGRALELSPRARRHPLLFGWGDLMRLRRQGLLR